MAGQLERGAAAAEGRRQDRPFQGRLDQGCRRHHPVHRLSAQLPVPHRRSEAQDRQPHVAGRALPGRRLGEEPEAFLYRHAGPVLHLQHVRRAGLVRARRHHGPHQIAVGRGDGRARREMAGARGNARGCRADDLVPGRLHQGAAGADRLSLIRHRGDQPDLHGVGAPQGRGHHELPRPRLPLADDRHDGAAAPHALAARRWTIRWSAIWRRRARRRSRRREGLTPAAPWPSRSRR